MKIERPLTVCRPGCLLWIPVLRSFGTKIVVWNLHWQELQLLLSQISHQYYLHCRIFCTSCTVNSVSRSSHKNGSKIVSFRLCTGCWEFWTNFKPNQARGRLISIEFKIFKSVEISRPFFWNGPDLSFGMVHVKHIRPWHVAIVGSLFVDCLGRRNQLQNPHKRIPVTFITKPKQWATKMFPVWCDQRSTLGTMCPVRQITFPDTRPAGTVC